MTEESGARGLRKALAEYTRARSAALAIARRDLHIGEGDAIALLHIADHPGIRPTQLREHLGITAAGVTALIDRLVDRGAVRRDVDLNDRRVNRITLTIDIAEEPWAQLTRFDDDFDLAVGALEGGQAGEFATLLDALTADTLTRGAR
ncbi:MarR family winged helix-turn-helix transcriptional regulator [Microbacterium sp. B2969]|uniref:MarR family winged helix-turn-helix transcriptional regulator n=1 Tax=Microbacterium alkaliflavum TaxID=3248839 RepID=A0ABW7QCM1_9MICO